MSRIIDPNKPSQSQPTFIQALKAQQQMLLELSSHIYSLKVALDLQKMTIDHYIEHLLSEIHGGDKEKVKKRADEILQLLKPRLDGYIQAVKKATQPNVDATEEPKTGKK